MSTTLRHLAVALALSIPVAGGAQETDGRPPPRHFVYFGLERSRIADTAFLAIPAIAGAQLKYKWKELEPERDRYDFAVIRRELAFLEGHGKALFIQLQDVTFDRDSVNTPQYLLDDPEFGGGVALQYEFDEDEARPVAGGWVARRWDPAVRERLRRLFEALAREFDGRIAGINLPETSIGFARGAFDPPGYTYDGYFEGIKDLMSAARNAFRSSDVLIYANFMPGETLPDDDRGYLRGVYEHADRIGAGVGGPDLLPHRWFQRQNSLPLIAARAPGTVAGVAVQWGNLEDVDKSTGRRVTVEELADYAYRELHLDYIFWGTQQPYYSDEIIPFLRRLGGERVPRHH